jgi:hypothetical protein
MKMRFLSTRNHGLIGSLAIAAALTVPAVLRLDDVPASSWTLRLWGASGIALVAATDFELGAVRVIPMPAHLAIDVVMGASLAAGPWLLGGTTAGRRHWLPHALIGGSEILLALITRVQPSDQIVVVRN